MFAVVPPPRFRPGSISPLEEHASWLLTLIAEQPDLTLDEVVVAMRKRRIAGSRSAVFFDFVPTFKLFIAGNHKPRLDSVFVAEAKKYQVFPLDASVAGRIVAPRPNITAGRTEFVYTRPMTGLPQSNSPQLLNASYTITADIEVPQGGAEGMILTSGGRFGGYARARHPQHGVLLPAAFMPGAADASVIKLSELALASALNTGIIFSKLGVNIPITVNIQPAIVAKLAIEDIVKAQRPRADNWPGLIIDMREEDIISDLALAGKLSDRLEPHNVRLAIDEFGGGYAALAQFGEMPFAERKLAYKFIADCGTDKVNMPLCKSVIDLAHNYRRIVVAVGIEKAADAQALLSMGCDFGQSFLLGQPMPEERFIALLRQRSGTPARDLPAAAR